MQFKEAEWIRVGSHKKKLKAHPDHARRLWQTFEGSPFERRIAASDVDGSDVLQLIDYPSYFELMKVPLPDSRKGIMERIQGSLRPFVDPNAGRKYMKYVPFWATDSADSL